MTWEILSGNGDKVFYSTEHGQFKTPALAILFADAKFGVKAYTNTSPSTFTSRDGRILIVPTIAA